jgi:hypothetical protein
MGVRVLAYFPQIVRLVLDPRWQQGRLLPDLARLRGGEPIHRGVTRSSSSQTGTWLRSLASILSFAWQSVF